MKLLGVTAPFTGSGKTLTTMALLSLIPDAVSFKIGPDYIDGQMHEMITGQRSVSIDRWLQGGSYAKVPCRFGSRYSYGVVEGVMGFRDSGSDIDLSTHFYFEKMGIPYILVLNVARMAESAYFMAKGFMGRRCLGVVINEYYSQRHLEMVERPFREKGVRIIGTIRHDGKLTLPERHLGINTDISPAKAREIAAEAGKGIDLSFLHELKELPCGKEEGISRSGDKSIWIAQDPAFNFYYETSLTALSRLGEMHYFSPLKNEVPENPDLIYIGGGYPELYAKELTGNTSTISAIRDASGSGVPIIGECGGLMYLEKSIETEEGSFDMAGIFPGKVNRISRLTLGYTRLRAIKPSLLFGKGETAYGHEFHYSTVSDDSEKLLFNERGKGMDGSDGIQVSNTFASYSHFDLERYFPRLKRLVERRR